MRRILAVDDDSDILEVIQYILEESGYEVETLTDGHYLFDKIKESQPDLILLDIMLGNLDGRELCRSVKNSSETQNIPVILVSASHDVSKSLNQIGAPNDFIAKPFDIEDLLGSISKQLNTAA
ncbi:response regulator [Mucilaginibacter pocheonensis]|uniref:Two-component system phosphate regulon response regulator PhoB n=1 Tax=Mucilaginibacter pocheonensis TaxID=398050 RepID=A0ABU1THS7_9SPHI|nr:response regulator [Mucilaginibacter pocheonensis]MDR6944979.1 two-component system phosphate regulon response regulator PhoB [Mucilaginibacter pocheonensis]